ncbi:putative bactericidal permeability-increasing protein, alpha/beta [Lupinus albus]|uniref:Putative bactericidal permeability-increasing protein, alpha/beta n=1 Tax=Lupinus albus TaxID=3870 RepID=A0A6A4MV14_LUPAL|nr:putative bactericidal permeability-increasing protein, alpha/beta [Lupinus albus]
MYAIFVLYGEKLFPGFEHGTSYSLSNNLTSVVSSVLKTVLIPFLNSQLKRGIPLPMLNGFALENAGILYAHPWVTVSTDVAFLGHSYLKQKTAYDVI